MKLLSSSRMLPVASQSSGVNDSPSVDAKSVVTLKPSCSCRYPLLRTDCAKADRVIRSCVGVSYARLGTAYVIVIAAHEAQKSEDRLSSLPSHASTDSRYCLIPIPLDPG